MSDSNRLNLGCGFDRREGWLNVDGFAGCGPDLVMDIEATPWPFATDRFDHVLMKHVLEHVGAETRVFAAVVRELHRVLAPGGCLEVHVPHVRHDSCWSDPTHVRAFTALSFDMLSRRRNGAWIEAGANYSPLALMWDVDFEVERVVQLYTPTWSERLARGEVTARQLAHLSDERWNVAQEIQATLRAVKRAPAPASVVQLGAAHRLGEHGGHGGVNGDRVVGFPVEVRGGAGL